VLVFEGLDAEAHARHGRLSWLAIGEPVLKVLFKEGVDLEHALLARVCEQFPSGAAATPRQKFLQILLCDGVKR